MTWLDLHKMLCTMFLAVTTSFVSGQTQTISFFLTDFEGDGWDAYSEYGIGNQDGGLEILDEFGSQVAYFPFTDGFGYGDEIDLNYGCYQILIHLDYYSTGSQWNFSNLTTGELIGFSSSDIDGEYGPYVYGISLGADCDLGCTDPAACNYDDTATLEDGTCCYINCVEIHVSATNDDYEDHCHLYDAYGVYHLVQIPGNVTVCLDDGCHTLNFYNGGLASNSYSIDVYDIDGNLTVSDGIGIPSDASEQWIFGVERAYLDIDVTPGIYPGEITWTLADLDNLITHSGGAPISTNVCALAGCNVLTLEDGFGDGWNGAYINISHGNEQVVSGLTLNDGYTGYEYLTLGGGSEPCGCTDPTACNYDPNANYTYTDSCTYPGCQDPLSCDYDPNAGCDAPCANYPVTNDLCEYAYDITAAIDGPGILGSTDILCHNTTTIPEPCNDVFWSNNLPILWYSVEPENGVFITLNSLSPNSDHALYIVNECTATETVGCGSIGLIIHSCVFLEGDETLYIGVGDKFGGLPGEFEMTIQTWDVCGCLDQAACNYRPDATEDDGICFYNSGCTDPLACNYDITAGCDDESCSYPGCNDPVAFNYDTSAGCDDGSCLYSGCTYPSADNFDAGAYVDDGSCQFSPSTGCSGDFNGDNQINTTDLLGFLSVFGTNCIP